MLILLFLACHPATPPEAAPLASAPLVADPCAEGVAYTLRDPHPIPSYASAMELSAYSGFPFMFLDMRLRGEFSGPDCVFVNEEEYKVLRGVCFGAEGLRTEGELVIDRRGRAYEARASGFVVRDAEGLAVWRYDGRSWEGGNEGERQIATVGTFSLEGEASLINGAVNEIPGDLTYTLEFCSRMGDTQISSLGRVHVLVGEGPVGDVIIDMDGASYRGSGPTDLRVRGSSSYHMTTYRWDTDPVCVEVERDGEDAGLVCMGE